MKQERSEISITQSYKVRAAPKAVLDAAMDGDGRVLWRSSGREGALPWPVPDSFSAHEMQLDFSKLLRKEPEEDYF